MRLIVIAALLAACAEDPVRCAEACEKAGKSMKEMSCAAPSVYNNFSSRCSCECEGKVKP
jgi:hypothetical protein